MVGVPFYGRGWAEVAADRNGRYQRGKPIEPRMDLNHGHLADIVGRDGFERFWDAESRAHALWNASRRIFITYEAGLARPQGQLHRRARPRGGYVLGVFTARMRRGRCSMRSTRRSVRQACSH